MDLPKPPAAASTGQGAAPVNKADLKQVQKRATDATYFRSAVAAARKWVDSVELNGTPAEKALAHKWLDVHEGAVAAGDQCRGCDTCDTHSRADKYFTIGSFYEEQGRDFKAYAKRWEKLGYSAMEEETGEHIPTTAEAIAGVADSVTGQIGQMRRDQARAAEDLRRLKEQQAEAQRRQQEQQADAQRRMNEEAARQETARLEGYKLQREGALLEQEARNRQAAEGSSPQRAQAMYHTECIMATVSRGKVCGSQDSTSIVLRNSCSQKLDVTWCLEDRSGTWSCFAAVAPPLSPESEAGPDWVCNGTGRYLIWARDPGDRVTEWPKPPGPVK